MSVRLPRCSVLRLAPVPVYRSLIRPWMQASKSAVLGPRRRPDKYAARSTANKTGSEVGSGTVANDTNAKLPCPASGDLPAPHRTRDCVIAKPA